MPAPLPAGDCPSSQRSHFSLSTSSMSEAPSQRPQPQWPEISLLFCFLYGFSQSPTANSLPRLLLFFFVCVCGAAQMLLNTHTHSLTRYCFPSALCCPQLLTIAAFFSCKTLFWLPAVLPTSLFNSSALAHSVFRMGGVVWNWLICISKGGM